MLSNLWGRITGKDKQLKYPDQQAAFLGRIGDYTIVFPYGLYADLPAETLLKEIAPKVAVPVTVDRPSDTEQDEPVLFHPATGTRIIMRNNGDVDIIAAGDVNVQAANVTMTGNLTVQGNTSLGATVTSNGKDISDTHGHTQDPDSGGDVQAPISGVT